VDLRVYTMLGQEVSRLVSDVREPGLYSVRFDGAELASGMYIVRLSAESGFSQTRRMMLLK
jgi:hypothetical protein